ncbi:hypothetical protein HFP15_32820 [Amycolatopsis sp. K13G38]|uniref:Uncharacterized protein n=1 Tax=Amycolatopsis acididurans TaxID=2724524 RepID=A0ABX1JGW1_9PSEU|nr:hypothetical protein [Amycolatopsis acididurans]NKQ57655.1 hypothetical protein [Amycolatopsis acididurans]
MIAHHLEPLSDLPNEIDAVWILLAETHLVIWSRVANRWTNLLFSGGPVPPATEDDDVLIAVDEEFRHLIGDDQASPFAFTLTASDSAVGRTT